MADWQWLTNQVVLNSFVCDDDKHSWIQTQGAEAQRLRFPWFKLKKSASKNMMDQATSAAYDYGILHFEYDADSDDLTIRKMFYFAG